MTIRRIIVGCIYLVAAFVVAYLTPVFATERFSIIEDGENQTLIIDDAPDMKVIAFSKDVVIKKRAKEVLAWGGNVTVEGSVDGDVATIGGSVIHKEGGYIGGDVIVFGGRYETDGVKPLRAEGKDTVMFGMFEEELRGFAKDPTQILKPELTISFLVQRLVAIMFWFLVTIAAATITPGAVGRAIAGLKLTALKIGAIGAAGFIMSCIAVILGLSFLPEYLSAIVSLMAFVLIMLAYGFARVVVHVLAGRFVMERIFSQNRPSESLAILVGVVASVGILSLPYVWPIALFGYFAVGTGLVLSARSAHTWKAS